MKTTTNYHLNQWDPGDRLLRTDFNGDNGKIDAAIHAAETAAKDAVAAEATARGTAITALIGKVTAVEGKVTTVEGKAGARPLGGTYTGSSATKVNVYFSDVDWSAWHVIHIEIEPATGPDSTVLYLGGDSQAVGVVGSNGTEHTSFGHLILYPLFDSRHTVCGISLGDSSRWISSNLRFRDFSYLTLSNNSGGVVPSGSLVRIWGAK